MVNQNNWIKSDLIIILYTVSFPFYDCNISIGGKLDL